MSSVPHRRRWVLLALLAAFACLLSVGAGAESPRFRARLPDSLADVEVLGSDGTPLRVFFHAGTAYVLGERGERYSLRIHNPSSTRVEVVLSIDGRDAISGRVADYRSQRGYLIPAYGSITVDGFRQSLGRVATFRFSERERAYSARLGTPQNLGVIGVAFYRERPSKRATRRLEMARDDAHSAPRAPATRTPSAPSPAPVREPARPRGFDAERHVEFGGERSAGAAPPAPRAAPQMERPRLREPEVNRLGTEYGEVRESRVEEVPFERRSREPERVVTLRYDDAEGLSARGIVVEPRAAEPFDEPEAFPASRFAAPPP